MKVVLFCGGMGTRLREETEFRPKPMVNIGPRPILWHIMKIYSHFGYNEFVLALGYKGEMIKNYFCNYELMNSDLTVELGQPHKITLHGRHDESEWKITLVDTGQNTLKGGRLKRVEKYIDGDRFMLSYGDGVADIDIQGLVEFHTRNGKMATVTGVNPASRFGEMKVEENRVKRFYEKPESNSQWINGGFFVLERNIFNLLREDETCDLEFGAIERIAREGDLMVYKHEGFWACMDTMRDMSYLNDLWNKNEAKWKVW